MREITEHKINEANDQITIFVLDEPGNGGANYEYRIEVPGRISNHLKFQDGLIVEAGVNGITQEVLIAICIDRLRSFQAGGYACRENALALTKLEEAQMWLHKRTLDCMARGVEGTHKI